MHLSYYSRNVFYNPTKAPKSQVSEKINNHFHAPNTWKLFLLFSRNMDIEGYKGEEQIYVVLETLAKLIFPLSISDFLHCYKARITTRDQFEVQKNQR